MLGLPHDLLNDLDSIAQGPPDVVLILEGRPADRDHACLTRQRQREAI